MKTILLLLFGGALALSSASAAQTAKFPSPNGQFTVLVDDDESTGALVDAASHNVLQKLEDLFTSSDKAVWSADSNWVACSHNGGKITETSVYLWDGSAFQSVKLPYLPDVDLKIPHPKHKSEDSSEHLDHDTTLPVRWIVPLALVLSKELAMSASDDQTSTLSTRRDLITVKFDAARKVSIQTVVKGKQKTVKE